MLGSSVRSPCPCAPPQVPRPKTSTPITTTLLFYSHARSWRLVSFATRFLRSSNEKHCFTLHCCSLQDFIKCIIPSHALLRAKKSMCHSEIYLAGIHSTWLGSSTYLIYWEVLQLLSYSLTIGTDATGMMSAECWVGLSLSN